MLRTTPHAVDRGQGTPDGEHERSPSHQPGRNLIALASIDVTWTRLGCATGGRHRA